jgi:beta-glucanase (GH16 family)
MAVPVNSSWKLTFDDEFNGTTLNTSKWSPNWFGGPGQITKPVNSYENGAYDPGMVSVSGGVLHLRDAASPVTVNGVYYPYRTGAVSSANKFEQSEGYFEARIFVPAAPNGLVANWPSFFTTSHNWPTGGEMDVLEGLVGHAAYHYHSSNINAGGTPPGNYTGWHTFGGLWENGSVEFYYDNQLVGAITGNIPTSYTNFMVLVNSIDTRGVIAGPTVNGADMQVDWVHVYSDDPNARAVTPDAGYTGPGGGGASPPPPPPGGGMTGSSGNDNLVGSGSADNIEGLGGNDTINGNAGNDNLMGNAGNDQITGGAGSDSIIPGAGKDDMWDSSGNDWFEFKALSDSTVSAPDEIANFRHGQIIDLSAIDANANASGNQAFSFAGSAFTGVAGQVIATPIAGLPNHYLIRQDVNGDRVADMAEHVSVVSGFGSWSAGDFSL